MESPETSKIKNQNGHAIKKVICTPKNEKTPVIPREESSLYHLHRDSSPNIRAGQDVLEVGWGDSPEPLNIEQKFELNKTPAGCKKKLESKESPKSSIPFKRRNVRSTSSLPSDSIIDVAKYVAEVQELSKNIMKEFNCKKIDRDLFQDENSLGSTQVIKRDSGRLSPVQKFSEDSSTESKDSGVVIKSKNSIIDNVLQAFIDEEDDWLSQALFSQEVTKTPVKSNFVKSKSENELSLPQLLTFEKKNLAQNYRNKNNNFRRTSSFDITQHQGNSNYVNSCAKNISQATSSFKEGSRNINQYSLQEIERKRLEAKYRRERKEIERRKLEALKKLKMKKLRAIKT